MRMEFLSKPLSPQAAGPTGSLPEENVAIMLRQVLLLMPPLTATGHTIADRGHIKTGNHLRPHPDSVQTRDLRMGIAGPH